MVRKPPSGSSTPSEIIPSSDEISINYSFSRSIWNRHETRLNESFAFMIVDQIVDDTLDLASLLEAQRSLVWTLWKKAIDN